MMKILLPMAFLLTAFPCYAQDDDANGFVQHIKTPEELEYEASQKEEKMAPEDENTAVEKFAQSYFYAYRHGDIGSFRALVSSEDQKCLDAGQDNYFRDELARSTHTGKIDTMRWKFLDTSYDDHESYNQEDDSSRPKDNSDRQLEISWQEEGATVRHDVTLKVSSGKYYMSVPCSVNGQGQNPFSQGGLGGLFGNGNGQNNGTGSSSMGGYGTLGGGSDDGPTLRDFMMPRR